MRIGLITGEYPPMQGGVGDFCHSLALRLTEAGHTVQVLSGPAARTTDPRIPVTAARWGVGVFRAVRRWARDERLDLLNLHFQTAAYGMSPWVHFLPGRLRGLPLVTTFHDLRFPYLFPKAGPLRDRVVMHLARSSAAVVATNHEDLLRLSHLPRHVLIPISSSIPPETVPAAEAARWRAQAGAGDNDFLLAHFGFINSSKGLDVLLRATVSLRAQGLPLRLLMIGGRTGSSDPANAAYLEEIEQLAAKLGLAQAISWTGFVTPDEVSACLAAADAVALPFRDGASYRRSSLMTAIAHGCAIITTTPRIHIPAFTEQNLQLVPPGDDAALALAIRALYTSPDLRAQLRQGAARLSTHFDWARITDQYQGLFRQVTGAKP